MADPRAAPHIEGAFSAFTQATLETIPQPEELPPEDRRLEVEDLEPYPSQLDPFLASHGYEPTEY